MQVKAGIVAGDGVSDAGQWFGACATATAVIVALALAHCEGRRQRAAAEKAALTQARLVVTGKPSFIYSPNGQEGTVVFEIDNHSERPILDVRAEVWRHGTDLSLDPLAAKRRILVPAEKGDLRIGSLAVALSDHGLQLRAWRVRWTDPDGRSWQVDQDGQETPDLYTGQAPRPSGA